MAIIVTVVLVVENSQSQNYPPYRDNGKQIALLQQEAAHRGRSSHPARNHQLLPAGGLYRRIISKESVSPKNHRQEITV